MSAPDQYEPLSVEPDAAELRMQRVGIVFFIAVILAAIGLFFWQRHSQPQETGDAQQEAEMQFMKEFLSEVQSVAFETYSKQGGLSRDQFEAAWSDHLESLSATSPEFARTARRLWDSNTDIWGHPLIVERQSRKSESSVIVITVQNDPARREFKPTAFFYATSWKEPAHSTEAPRASEKTSQN